MKRQKKLNINIFQIIYIEQPSQCNLLKKFYDKFLVSVRIKKLLFLKKLYVWLLSSALKSCGSRTYL